MNINPVSQKGVQTYPSAEENQSKQAEQYAPVSEKDFWKIQNEIATLIAILSGDKEPPQPQMIMGLVYMPFIRGIVQKIRVKKLISQLKEIQNQQRFDTEEMEPPLTAILDTINRLRPKASPAMFQVLMRISTVLNEIRKLKSTTDTPTHP